MYEECHGHIFMNGTNFAEARQLHCQGVCTEDVRNKLALLKSCGVPYFRDGGDCYGVSEYARSIAGEYGIEYVTPVFAIHKNGHYGSIVGKGFDNLKEYHCLVKEVAQHHGDFIKVMFSGILDFSTDGGLGEEPPDRDEIREMIHIAHEEGFAVMAHVNGAKAVLAALEGGVDSVEHGNFMDDDCLHALAEGNAVWVPTNVTIHNLLYSDRYNKEVINRLDELQKRSILKAYALGADLAPGSDAGAYMVPIGRGTIDEWNRLIELLGKQDDVISRLSESTRKIRRRFCKFY